MIESTKHNVSRIRVAIAACLLSILFTSILPVQLIHEIAERDHVVMTKHQHDTHENLPCITTDYADCPCIQLHAIPLFDFVVDTYSILPIKQFITEAHFIPSLYHSIETSWAFSRGPPVLSA